MRALQLMRVLVASTCVLLSMRLTAAVCSLDLMSPSLLQAQVCMITILTLPPYLPCHNSAPDNSFELCISNEVNLKGLTSLFYSCY